MQMNHTTKALAIVGVLAIAAALIGAVASSVLPAAHAASYTQKDPGKKNSIDFENSATNFSFKQKLKNNCSGFADCTNDATETLTPPR
jgi:FlaG/FlaF family flagellin (archaellin)